MTDLAGRVALVAGGTGPVGRAIAAELAAQGARVAVLSRSAAASLSDGGLAVQADITDRESVDAAISLIEAEFGSVDVLVNAAHQPMAPTRFIDSTDDDLTAQLDSVRGHATLCRRVLPGMHGSGWGRIVYVSGALMSRPAPGFAAYGAAKAAASTLTRYIALENGFAGVTANIVAPGRVIDPDDETPLTAEQEQLSARLLERMALDFPYAADVAGIVGTLVGAHSAHITGQTIWVTGGEPIS